MMPGRAFPFRGLPEGCLTSLEVIPMSDSGNVCCSCVGDLHLRAEIERTDVRGDCGFCGKAAALIWTTNALAKRIGQVFERHFKPVPLDPNPLEEELIGIGQLAWPREGESPSELIERIAGVSSAVANRLLDVFASEWTFGKDRFLQNHFDGDARYEERPGSGLEVFDTWSSLQEEVHHSSRYFSRRVREFLDDLFDGIHERNGQRPVVRAINPGDDDGSMFRARVATDTKKLKEILRDPPRQLSAPLGRLARANRMNASGVAALYAAFDESTCLAEVRPPVGSQVVVGRFELLRSVRVLDLEALEQVLQRTSHFDPNFVRDKIKVEFLRSLARQFSNPVMPGREDFDYLLPQVVTDYLAEVAQPRIDGVVFKSSQRNGDGRNIVLFRLACGVEPWDVTEGSIGRVDIGPTAFDGSIDEIYLVEEPVQPVQPSRVLPTAEQAGHTFRVTPAQINNPLWAGQSGPKVGGLTLRLSRSKGGLVVHRIRSVSYEMDPTDVMFRKRVPVGTGDEGPRSD
jgi:hypothetical protein